MEAVQVNVNQGTLLRSTFKNSTITSSNIKLMGDELVMEGNKVVMYKGSVRKSDETIIGTFSYNNGYSSIGGPAGEGYRCEVLVNKEEGAALQVEATNTLLVGIGKLQETNV